MKRVHLIAIGGAIMHNLAIALQNRGYMVTGSDDVIYDPAKSNLERKGLLPDFGWNADSITSDIDVVILGMHARQNNPELHKAKELGLTIMSFPEFVANECHDKKRVVVAGSHGKTTTTAMIMFVLNALNIEFDYLVGSSIEGFDLSVKLTDAPLIIIEGDEYLSSALDLKSKFLWYNPHLSIITGIAYDHINVFPTFDVYLKTFADYIESHTADGVFFWYEKDEHLQSMASNTNVSNKAYQTPEYVNSDGSIAVKVEDELVDLEVVGEHNLQNLEAASLVCQELGISRTQFYKAASKFTGAGKRMEKIFHQNGQVVYRDFAHSPSKLEATTQAIASTYNTNPLLAVFELHTFSSLNKEFLPYYKSTMDNANDAVVFYNTEVFAQKKMEPLTPEFVKACFGDVRVITDIRELESLVARSFAENNNVLLMSSGKFAGAEFDFS